VVVVAAIDATGVEECEFAAGDGNRRDAPGAVDVEQPAVGRPVGRLEAGALAVHQTALAGGDRDDFEAGFATAFLVRPRHAVPQDDIREHRGFEVGRVVRADGEPRVQGFAQRERNRTDRLEGPAGPGHGGGEHVAVAFELHGGGRLDRGAHTGGRTARHAAELQLDQAVAVHRNVDVGRIGRESRTQHGAGLAVRLLPRALPGDVDAEDEIAGQLLPDEVKRIRGAPDVRAAAGDAVLPSRRVELRPPRPQVGADIGGPLEEADRGHRPARKGQG
jgi:hypothetical protein